MWTVEDTLQNCEILDGNLIEAGTYHGDCLSRLAKGKHFNEIWSFDSYEGLPDNHDGNPDWQKGSFNVLKDDNFSCIQEAMDFIRKRVGREDTHLIVGWFKNTLTQLLGEELYNTCSYTNIDCDIFSSTKEFLDWLFQYKVMKEGCIIRFDDWVSGLQCGAGNPKAFKLIMNKYNPTLEPIAINVFRLISYND